MKKLQNIIFILACSLLIKVQFMQATDLIVGKEEFGGFSMQKSFFENSDLKSKDFDKVCEYVTRDFSKGADKKYLKIIAPIAELITLSLAKLGRLNSEFRNSILHKNIPTFINHSQPVVIDKKSVKLIKCLIRTDEELIYFHFLMEPNSNL